MIIPGANIFLHFFAKGALCNYLLLDSKKIITFFTATAYH